MTTNGPIPASGSARPTQGMDRARRMHRSLTILMLAVLGVMVVLSYMLRIGVVRHGWLWLGVVLAVLPCAATLASRRIALSYSGSVAYCFLLLGAVECVSYAMPLSYVWLLCVIPMIWAGCRLSLPMLAVVDLGGLLVVFVSAMTGASPGVMLLRIPMFVGGAMLMVGLTGFVWQGRDRGAPAVYQTQPLQTAPGSAPSSRPVAPVSSHPTEPQSGSLPRPERSASASRDLLMMIHDLRSPLSSVIGYVELTLQHEGLGEEARKDLTVALRNAEKLDASIVCMVHADASGMPGKRMGTQRVDFATIVSKEVEEYREQAATQRVRIDANVEHDLMITADPLQLRSLVGNLLSNAVKYNRPGGSVYVSALRDGGCLVLEVTDTGIGIPVAELGRVREPYVRASNAADSAPGTGMGLHHCQVIVNRLNGSMDINSEVGKGTVVMVTLPSRH